MIKNVFLISTINENNEKKLILYIMKNLYFYFINIKFKKKIIVC